MPFSKGYKHGSVFYLKFSFITDYYRLIFSLMFLQMRRLFFSLMFLQKHFEFFSYQYATVSCVCLYTLMCVSSSSVCQTASISLYLYIRTLKSTYLTNHCKVGYSLTLPRVYINQNQVDLIFFNVRSSVLNNFV